MARDGFSDHEIAARTRLHVGQVQRLPYVELEERHLSKLAEDIAARDSLVDQLVEMAAHEDDRERRLRELALHNLQLLAVRNFENWRSVRTSSGGPPESELDTAAFLADVFCRVCGKFGARN